MKTKNIPSVFMRLMMIIINSFYDDEGVVRLMSFCHGGLLHGFANASFNLSMICLICTQCAIHTNAWSEYYCNVREKNMFVTFVVV